MTDSNKLVKIGIFGGTFDPIHVGHLIIAEQAREQAHLDQVWFVPSARPPHKLKNSITSFDHRVNMLQLAIIGQYNFYVKTIERDRPGPSFTVDTLSDIHQTNPDNEYYLIIGADSLNELHTWKDAKRIVDLSTLLVATRHGCSLEQSIGNTQLKILDLPTIEISSSVIRQRVAEGRSILYTVPMTVEVYIREKRLYK